MQCVVIIVIVKFPLVILRCREAITEGSFVREEDQQYPLLGAFSNNQLAILSVVIVNRQVFVVNYAPAREVAPVNALAKSMHLARNSFREPCSGKFDACKIVCG